MRGDAKNIPMSMAAVVKVGGHSTFQSSRIGLDVLVPSTPGRSDHFFEGKSGVGRHVSLSRRSLSAILLAASARLLSYRRYCF